MNKRESKLVRAGDNNVIYAQKTIYNRFYKIYEPFAPIVTNQDPNTIKNKRRDIEKPFERSTRRTKKNIKDYVFNNEFDYFVSFTYKPKFDTNLKRKKVFKDWIKNQQKRTGKFEYIFVSELHKSGLIHFHGLIKGYGGKVLKAINRNSGKLVFQKGKQVYNFVSFTSGHSHAKKIGEGVENQIFIGHYISKYITKELIYEPNVNRYWVSSGLKKPKVVNNPDESYRKITPIYTLPTEHGFIKYYENEPTYD